MPDPFDPRIDANRPDANRAAPNLPREPTAAAGTLARDANEVKATPAGWIRERVHIGDGNFKWSEPFDPLARAKEEAEAAAEKMAHRMSGQPKPAPEKE